MSVQSWTPKPRLLCSVLDVVIDKGFGCIVSLDHTALPRYWIHGADCDAEMLRLYNAEMLGYKCIS